MNIHARSNLDKQHVKPTVVQAIAWDRQDPWMLCRLAGGQGARCSEFVTLTLGQELYVPEKQYEVVLQGRREIVWKEVLPTYGFLRWADPARPLQIDTLQRHSSFIDVVKRLAHGKQLGDRDGADAMDAVPVMVKNSEVVDLLVQSAGAGIVKATNSIVSSLLGTTIAVPYGPLVGFQARIVKIRRQLVHTLVAVFGREQSVVFQTSELFPNIEFGGEHEDREFTETMQERRDRRDAAKAAKQEANRPQIVEQWAHHTLRKRIFKVIDDHPCEALTLDQISQILGAPDDLAKTMHGLIKHDMLRKTTLTPFKYSFGPRAVWVM